MVKIVLCHGISATVSDLRRKSNLGFPMDFVFIYKNGEKSVIERNSTTLAITCISVDYKESDGV